MQRSTIVLAFLITIIAVLALCRYVLLSSYTAQGFALQHMDEQIKMLQDENMQLRDTLVQDESLTRIASVAAAEGFVPVQAIIYIKR